MLGLNMYTKVVGTATVTLQHAVAVAALPEMQLI